MAWIVGLVLAIGFVWLMVANETFRKIGFGLIALVGLGAIALWQMGENSNREFRAELAREKSAIPHSAVQLRDLTLSQGPYASLSGTVLNNSAYPIKALTIQVSVRDCPSVARTGCTIIGQDDAVAYVEVPPGQARQLSASVDLTNAAPATGYWGWTYGIKDISAKLD